MVLQMVDIWGGIKAKVNIGVDANNVRNTDMVNPFYGQYSETTGVGGLISVSPNVHSVLISSIY